MRFGFRMPSLGKRVAGRRSGLGGKRYWRHRVGVKAPRGTGFVTNPKKYAYNKIYSRTTRSADSLAAPLIALLVAVFAIALVVEVLGTFFISALVCVAAAAIIAAVTLGILLAVAYFFPKTRPRILKVRDATLGAIATLQSKHRGEEP